VASTMEELDGRIPSNRKSEDYNNTRPSDLLAKPHHHFMAMYNSAESVQQLERLRVASELEAFRHRHMMEFPETTITRWD